VTNLKGLVTISPSPESLFSLSDMFAMCYGSCSVVVWRQWVAWGRS
jgi:hypothetical protein